MKIARIPLVIHSLPATNKLLGSCQHRWCRHQDHCQIVFCSCYAQMVRQGKYAPKQTWTTGASDPVEACKNSLVTLISLRNYIHVNVFRFLRSPWYIAVLKRTNKAVSKSQGPPKLHPACVTKIHRKEEQHPFRKPSKTMFAEEKDATPPKQKQMLHEPHFHRLH